MEILSDKERAEFLDQVVDWQVELDKFGLPKEKVTKSSFEIIFNACMDMSEEIFMETVRPTIIERVESIGDILDGMAEYKNDNAEPPNRLWLSRETFESVVKPVLEESHAALIDDPCVDVNCSNFNGMKLCFADVLGKKAMILRGDWERELLYDGQIKFVKKEEEINGKA